MTAAFRMVRLGTALAAVSLTVLGAAGTAAAQAPAAAQQRPVAAAAASVDYATWQADVQAVMAEARPYVERRIAEAGGQQQAIVLDIDNTSLETHFQVLPPTPAVAPVRDLARYAHDRGVAIFFVTARPDLIGAVTKANLTTVGYPVTGLYQRSLLDLFGSPAEFKTAKRAEIEAKGYTIIANIGNNTTDLVGGHAEATFKLPDYDGQLS
ncbi:hydrolase [Streptomyces pharetrae CZA14]|uniref:Hydrolase n=1 Tax=Streptomyces pharetrae CZA14 TaxID=1144883 RepID=A0ABX3YSC7_9ACTN|nr:hydrolase [Streptomyces pharetrae CZA14]